MNNLKFVTYARRSSSGKSKQVESIPDQEKIFRDLIRQEQLKVVHWYSEAKSAKKPNMRPVFDEMLLFLRNGKANAILIWHLNRLCRNQEEYGKIQQLLHDGVIQCIKTPEREYHPEDHALLFAVEASMSSQYPRDLSRDVKRGTTEKALKGWYPFKPKAGYELDDISRELIPDPKRFSLLRRGWELMLSGDKSVPQVLEELNGMGYRTQRTKTGGNRPMPRSSLYRLFTDPFYMGVFEYEGEVLQGKHRPMVTKQEFERVQHILGRPLKPNLKTYFHPYAGMIRCGVCGLQVTAETHVKKRASTGDAVSYTYYHCTGRKGCPKTSRDEGDIERQILRDLTGCRLNPRFVDWSLELVKREEEAAWKLEKVTTSTSSDSELIVSRRLESLYTMREDGELTREEFTERKNKYQAELEALREKEAYAHSKTDRDRETLKNLLTFTRDGYVRFTKGGKEAKRAVAREFSNGYVLTQGNLGISLHPALDKVRAFELKKYRGQQSKSGGPDAQFPYWRAMLDEIKKSVSSCKKPFPAEW
jgi:site-specific DNA recombinase